MRQGTCSVCGLTTTIRSFYSMNGKTYCEPCVWKASREAKEAGQPGQYTPVPDNSVCARCGAYSGDVVDHPLVGQLRLCEQCGPQVSNWPYPQWLKISLAVTLLLLVIALIHGRKYFKAGKDMYVGERMVEEKHYKQALPYLVEALKIAPGSDKAVLLTAKAALAIGDIETADRAIHGHDQGHFEDASDSDFQEVKQTWERAMNAEEKAEEASKLEQQGGHEEEAARLMHQAASTYPESANLLAAAESYDAGVAFTAKDYDKFLALEEEHAKKRPGWPTSDAVASALACKYAVTGDASYKQRAEQLLASSDQQVSGNPDAEKEHKEYSERIRYRLESRQIIDTAEYNSRFRGAQKSSK